MTNIVRTKIYTDEQSQFRSFLLAAGFANFILQPQSNGMYLNIEFTTPESIFHYTLRGIEASYMGTRSAIYYYDLDQDWDDEASECFGDDDEI